MIDFTPLRAQLDAIQPLTEAAWQAFVALLEPTELGKGDYLLMEGQRAHFAYLLMDGVVRVFYNRDGSEYNKTFFTPGMFPTALTALLSGEPCDLNFQALTNCQTLRFSYLRFRALFSEHRCLESLMLRILEREWINKERHDIQMVTNDATTNYLIFRAEYPELEQLIPQYHIASYLGITPIQLSRIRAQLLKQSSS
ncbi:MAG: Crp/Fnr family transcriptional regulator [Lewinella sp.]|nr:Crp/Fnr family transcriptional regulator [Lewinella sp.]